MSSVPLRRPQWRHGVTRGGGAPAVVAAAIPAVVTGCPVVRVEKMGVGSAVLGVVRAGSSPQVHMRVTDADRRRGG